MDSAENWNPENRYVRELIDTMVSECRDPARLLELYYWSIEPDLLPVIRGFASFPNETRHRFGQFLLAVNPKAVNAEMETDRQIRLTWGAEEARPFAEKTPLRAPVR